MKSVLFAIGALSFVAAEILSGRPVGLPLQTVLVIVGVLHVVGYAAYGAALAIPAARRKQPNEGQPWNIGETIGVAWQAFIAKPALLIVGTLLMAAPIVLSFAYVGFSTVTSIVRHVQNFGQLGVTATSPPALLQAALKNQGVVIALGAAIVATITLPVFTGGLLKLYLRPVRGEAPRLGDLAAGFAPKRFGALVAAPFIQLLPLASPLACVGALQSVFQWEVSIAVPIALGAVQVLTTLFLLPAFALTNFYIVDADLGPVAATAASWRATRGHRAQLFFYQLALGPTIFIGAMALGLGVFFTLLVYQLGLAYICTRVSGETPRPLFSPDWGSRYLRNFLRTTFAVNLVAFAVAVVMIMTQAPQRTVGWSIGNTVVRVVAILLGVTLISSMLSAALPPMLDILEKRGFSTFVGARHVRSQKSGFLTVISLLAISGVSLSSCSLESVSSIMGGFSADLKRKILGNNAHIVVDTESRSAWEGWQEVLAKARAVEGVKGATPIVQGEVMVQSASNLAGVIVRGVEPESIGEVIDLQRNIEVGKFAYLGDPDKLRRLPPDEVVGLGRNGERFLKGKDILPLPDDLDPDVRAAVALKPLYPAVVVGRELAKTLHVYVGDDVTLVSPLGDLGPMGVLPRMKKFRVAAIFYSGMYEYDASHVYITLDVAQEYFGVPGRVHFVDIRTRDVQTTDVTTPLVRSAIPRPELRVRDWREINRNLFSALKLERFAMFLILSIAIMVASFCIVCTLLLMVTEKSKEIAILKAMGASDGAILRTFIGEGVIIGGIGTAFGVTMSLALSLGLKWFGLPLNPEVYYIDRLPVNVEASDFVLVTLASLTICTLATIYPARAASRIRPVDGLRHE